ncbi:MAG TPA: protein kinase [Polyangiaceae bacterium]|nr:protein kinase [Polyangiaceae bacterium]
MGGVIPGSVLAGRYRLERQLGEGGMGSVWLAEHLALRSRVAIKIMDPAIASNHEGAERFRREAQAAASLRSTHVVQVLDFGLDELGPFLVMEVLQGQSLSHILQRTPRLDPRRVGWIIAQVARAMTRAHAANIVHRDLKPDNIFLVREDDQEIVKVLDFGIAKTIDPRFGGLQTQSGVTMGTPHYMSPEQAAGKRTVDYRTDLWAMGMIACECLVGRRVIEGDGWAPLLVAICVQPLPVPSTLGPVPPGFDAWFARATERDPERRFASAKELADTLVTLVGGPPGLDSEPPRQISGRGATVRTDSPLEARGPVTAPVLAATVIDAPAGRDRLVNAGAPPSKLRRRSWLWFAIPGAGIALTSVSLGYWLLQGNSIAPELNPTPLPSASAEALQPAAGPNPVEPQVVPDTPDTQSSHSGDPSRGTRSTPRRNDIAANGTPANGPRPNKEGSGKGPPTLMCDTDPFTGAVRPARQPSPGSFPCAQNPFTGVYVRR